ncbi:MAG: Fpg/Nei family DNA glycosylase [Acidimicrobiia bacterium]|nr:Fpg/Nei family DNA glycosylase [Acidimicrobiia bacterium]
MPEGHVTHRNVRLQSAALGLGQPIGVSSPQGRFREGAALLDGRSLEAMEAHGKHLFYHWEGDQRLHIHLGLIGKFQIHRGPAPTPTPNTRLVLRSDEATVFLAGPMICDVITPDEEQAIRDDLGPDPISMPRRGHQFVERLLTKKVAVGAALLDQSVIAGVGNVYRAELLFLSGIHPATPTNQLTEEAAMALWKLTVVELRRGVELGDILTVKPRDIGVRSRIGLTREEGVYVYNRGDLPCHRCGTLVRLSEVGGRKMWHCPVCQPQHRPMDLPS